MGLLTDLLGDGNATSGPLAVTTYNPGSTTGVAAPTTTGDVDATNLAVAFTAPASGAVLVRLTANGYAGVSLSTAVEWGLREGTTDVIVPSTSALTNSTDYIQVRHTFTLYVSGLTPGSSHTYKWSHRRTGTGDAGTQYGGAVGQAIMEVIAA